MMYPQITWSSAGKRAMDRYGALYNFFHGGATDILKNAIHIASQELIKHVSYDVLDKYIFYWVFAKKFLEHGGVDAKAKWNVAYHPEKLTMQYILKRKNYKPGIVPPIYSTAKYRLNGENLSDFIIRIKQKQCDTGRTIDKQCKALCGLNMDKCPNLALKFCSEDTKHPFSHNCTKAKHIKNKTAQGQVYLRKIHENEYNYCKTRFRSDKNCQIAAMNPDLLNTPIKAKWDKLWNTYCQNPDNLFKPECSCYFDTSTASKYTAPPECLLACRDPKTSKTNAYQPNDVMLNIVNKATCPNICSVVLSSKAGNLSIIKNIKIVQQCASTDNDIPKKSIPSYIINNFQSQCSAYVKFCKVTDRKIIPEIQKNIKKIKYIKTKLTNTIQNYKAITGTYKNNSSITIIKNKIKSIIKNNIIPFENSIKLIMGIDYGTSDPKKITKAYNKHKNDIQTNTLDVNYDALAEIINTSLISSQAYIKNRDSYVKKLNDQLSKLKDVQIFHDEMKRFKSMTSGDLKSEYDRILNDIKKGKPSEPSEPSEPVDKQSSGSCTWIAILAIIMVIIVILVIYMKR